MPSARERRYRRRYDEDIARTGAAGQALTQGFTNRVSAYDPQAADIQEQAERIAWRHMKDLTEQLLLAARLGIKTVPGAFMPDIEVWDDEEGETTAMGELFARRAQLEPGDRGVRLLPAGAAS